MPHYVPYHVMKSFTRIYCSHGISLSLGSRCLAMFRTYWYGFSRLQNEPPCSSLQITATLPDLDVLDCLSSHWDMKCVTAADKLSMVISGTFHFLPKSHVWFLHTLGSSQFTGGMNDVWGHFIRRLIYQMSLDFPWIYSRVWSCFEYLQLLG